MNKIYIGKIVNTHALKGELRIRSDFEYKNQVFNIGKELIIDDKIYKIRTYRKHKTFDMVTLNDYNNINDVLFLVNKNVYVDSSNLNLSNEEATDEELMTYKVITNTNETGSVLDIYSTGANNKVIKINIGREILVPYNKEFIEINRDKKEIKINLIEGM